MKNIAFIFVVNILIIASCNIETSYYTKPDGGDNPPPPVNDFCMNDYYPLTTTHISIFKDCPVAFDPAQINRIDATSIVGENAKSLHAGVYITDMMYAMVHKQPAEINRCYFAVKMLAEQLNLPKVSDTSIINKGIAENRLAKVLIEMSKSIPQLCADTALANEQLLMYLGMVVEELHLAFQLKNDDERLQTIIGSRRTLIEIAMLLILQGGKVQPDPLILQLEPDFKALKEAFATGVSPKIQVASSDQAYDNMIIMSKVKVITVKIDEQKVEQIRQIISVLRRKIVG